VEHLHAFLGGLATAIEAAAVIACTCGILAWVAAWITMLLDFRCKVMQARRGIWTFNPKKTQLKFTFTFFGMQISNGLITFAIIAFLVFFIALILCWRLTYYVLGALILHHYTMIIALLVPVVINALVKLLGTQYVGSKSTIMRRFSWMFFDLFQMLLSCVIGVAKGIARFVMVTVVNVLSLPRMDVSIFPAWVDYYVQIDSGAKSYFGMILMYHQHNNPLMRVSCWLLEDDARARRKLLRSYLPKGFDKLPPDEQEEATRTAQATWHTEYNEGKAALCSPSYRTASNMWNKLWMMHKNRAHQLSQYSADGGVMVSASIISKAAKERDVEILRKEFERLADKQDKDDEKERKKPRLSHSVSMLKRKKAKAQSVKAGPNDKAATEADVKVNVIGTMKNLFPGKRMYSQ